MTQEEFNISIAKEVGVDLVKEIETKFRNISLRADTPGVPDEYIDERTFDEIAHHFFRIGQETMRRRLTHGDGFISKFKGWTNDTASENKQDSSRDGMGYAREQAGDIEPAE